MKWFGYLTWLIICLAATKAVEAGVDGIIVSNHGARQLDFAPATVTVLEEVSFIMYYYFYITKRCEK